MAILLFLITVGVIAYVVARLKSANASVVDPWIDPEIEALEAIDRVLDACEDARQEMRRVADRSERSGRGSFRDKAW